MPPVWYIVALTTIKLPGTLSSDRLLNGLSIRASYGVFPWSRARVAWGRYPCSQVQPHLLRKEISRKVLPKQAREWLSSHGRRS
ncbi:hypothetical protein BC834DRAFT_867129 [Gloeopeniophorella convolvens]|nr:hypothetical protein BC834DRAFT_867129 [Gloeopeniophorella convolvens]